MRIIISVILAMSFVSAYSQASGGQIRRNKPASNVTNTRNANNSNNLYAKTGSHNGYDYVDLGLSVKWATCNVGAISPEQYGNYFAWGETSGRTDYGNIAQNRIRTDIGANISGTIYDASSVNMGGSWRMPQKAEVQELIDKCKWKKAKHKGVDGFCVTGPNNKSLFIPAAGLFIEKEKSHGYFVDMWTSTAEIEGRLCWVYHVHIDNNKYETPPVSPKLVRESYFVGMCIRPVINL